MKLTRRQEELLRAMCRPGWGARTTHTLSPMGVRVLDREGKDPGSVMTTTWPVLELLEKAGFVQQTDRWGNDSDGWDYEVTNEGRSAVFCNFPE